MKESPIQQKNVGSAQHEGQAPEAEGQSMAPPAFQLMASDGAASPPPAQLKPSSGGLPGDMLSGFAASTGHDLSNVQVHKNSDKPGQVGALAYAQGNEIHLGAGQEKHLAHEAAHIVQQREGRVQPTTQVNGKPVNDSASLENEADSMGTKAMQMKSAKPVVEHSASAGVEAIQRVTDYNALAQRMFTELDEYFPDLEDVLTILQEANWRTGFQQLSAAYNLVSPSKPLVIHLRETFGDADYRQIMEQVSGISVVEGGNDVRANTTESGYNLRADGNAGAAQIGRLVFDSMHVEVNGKSISGDHVFYKIQFTEADYARVTTGFDVPTLAPALAATREAWVTGDALGMYVSWDALIAQLQHFDIMTYDKTIMEKITMLRQMSHNSDLPFDEIIGTSGPGYYEDNRVDTNSFYQILREGKAVRTPNGELIDIYHFIVGLEAYQAPRDRASVSYYGITMNSNVGTSDGASTWAGDLGSAAADCLEATSTEYESHLRSEGQSTDENRINYYFRSRAPESDLLADIDAWGAFQNIQDGSATTVTELVNNYYGVQRSGGRAFARNRRRALENFFGRYGLTIDGGTYVTPANLAILREQINRFAVVWIQYRRGNPLAGFDATRLLTLSEAMATRFLDLIQRQFLANQ